MKRLPPIAERIIAAAALALGFLFMASIFVPDWTLAHEEPRSIAPPAADSTDPHENLVPLGSMESDQYIIRIYGRTEQPLYTIYTTDGQQLATLLTAEQVAELFPELPLPSVEFDAIGPLMYAGE